MKCPYCGSNASLVNSSVVYGRDYGMIYLCDNYPDCDAYVGTHKKTYQPLGTMANSELREWRKKAHNTFDPLWTSKRMNRHAAYKYLAQIMDLPLDDAHIGKFDIDQCKLLIQKILTIKSDL